MTAAERAFSDVKRGISPFPETRAEKAFREVKLGIGVPEAYWKSAIPDGFSAGIVAALNAAVAPSIKGINASVLASISPTIKGINATAFAGLSAHIDSMMPNINATALAALSASMGPGINAGALASASLQAMSASWPKFRTDQFLSPGTFSALQAAQLSAMKFDFGAMTDRPAGVLGRFDSALHVDLGLGAAVDSLIAAPTRRGPLGFDYGAVQRRTREVGDLLSENPPSHDLVEVVEEAQEVTGLDDGVMDGLSVFLGVPPPQGYAGGATAARILFIATLGTCVIVNDVETGQVLTLGSLLNAMVLGREILGWLREGRKPE